MSLCFWCDSQLQDEHHVSAVLVDVVQRDDVGVLDLLQDVHLALDLLPPHAPRARHALTLLDELGGELQTRALLSALLHDGKLAAGEERRQETRTQCERASEEVFYYILTTKQCRFTGSLSKIFAFSRLFFKKLTSENVVQH